MSWFKITKKSHHSTTCKIWMPVQSLCNSVMTSSEHINCHIGFISSTFLHGNCVFSDVSSKLVDNLCALHRVSLMSSVKSRQLSVGRWRPTSVHLKKEFHSTRRNFTEETNFLCSNFSILIFLNHKFTAQKKTQFSTPFWPQQMVEGECLRKSSPRFL